MRPISSASAHSPVASRKYPAWLPAPAACFCNEAGSRVQLRPRFRHIAQFQPTPERRTKHANAAAQSFLTGKILAALSTNRPHGLSLLLVLWPNPHASPLFAYFAVKNSPFLFAHFGVRRICWAGPDARGSLAGSGRPGFIYYCENWEKTVVGFGTVAGGNFPGRSSPTSSG